MSQSQALMESLERRMMLSVDDNFYINDDQGFLYTLNLINGVATKIGNMGMKMGDIALSPDGKLFGSGDYRTLYEINPITAETTYIGYMGDAINAMAFSDKGILYGADGSGSDILYRINKNTGDALFIGHTNNAVSAGDLVFVEKDIFYMSTADNELAWVDPRDAAELDLGQMGFSKVFGLGTNSDGVFYGVTYDGKLFLISNPQNGAGTFVANISGVSGGILGAASRPYTKLIIPPPPVSRVPTLARLNIGKFIALYEERFGESLNNSQRNGLYELLSFFKADTNATLQNDLRYAAYMLATTKHEAANTWQPVSEFGPRKLKGKKLQAWFNNAYNGLLGNHKGSNDGYNYRGRGYVQLTGRDNYTRIGKLLNPKQNLAGKPNLLLDPSISYQVLARGMLNGWFTGKSLGRYLTNTITSYEKARAVIGAFIVNKVNVAKRIASYASSFEQLLRDSQLP